MTLQSLVFTNVCFWVEFDSAIMMLKLFNPMSLTILSKNIIATLHQLHPLPSKHVPPLIFNYQQQPTFILNNVLFAQTLTIVPHMFSSGLSKMVDEHLWGTFREHYPFH
jgi:hypothetical protein